MQLVPLVENAPVMRDEITAACLTRFGNVWASAACFPGRALPWMIAKTRARSVCCRLLRPGRKLKICGSNALLTSTGVRGCCVSFRTPPPRATMSVPALTSSRNLSISRSLSDPSQSRAFASSAMLQIFGSSGRRDVPNGMRFFISRRYSSFSTASGCGFVVGD